jgi:transcriptional regulator with XRE-family HTH domain
MKTAGKELQDMRKQSGITQAELAKEMGVSGYVIWCIENEMRHPEVNEYGRVVAAIQRVVKKKYGINKKYEDNSIDPRNLPKPKYTREELESMLAELDRVEDKV